MPYSVYTRDKILKWMFEGDGTFTPPTTFYVALLSTNPSADDGTGLVEMTTGHWTSYARVADAASNWTGPTGTASPQKVTNTAQINPPGTSADATPITGFALYDALAAGNLIAWGTPTGGTQAVAAGTSVNFPAGSLEVDQ